MMKKTILAAILALVAIAPHAIAKNKKNDKALKRQEVVIDPEANNGPQEQTVAIINPTKQLYGEWTVMTVRKRNLETRDRAYVYLDFDNHMFYGSNGCNTINGKFTHSGSNISFKDIISTQESCHSNNDRGLLKAMAEVQHVQLTRVEDIEYMQLLNGKNNVLITLKRQNLDVLNGAWQVKSMGTDDVSNQNIRFVVDVDMLTVHANTGCNFINGVITLDPSKDFAIQFSDLRSSGHNCETLDSETQMLITLEQTECYQRIDGNDNEIAFKTFGGETTMIISRLNLK